MTEEHYVNDASNDEDDLASQLALLEAKLQQYGRRATGETFTTKLKIYWKTHNPGTAGPSGTRIFDQTVGDMLDLGGGNWIYVGTCSGIQYYKGQRPITSATSLEFKADTSMLTWSIAAISHVYGPLSDTSEKVQYRKDVSGKPEVIIVRAQTSFGLHYINPGSYTTFTE